MSFKALFLAPLSLIYIIELEKNIKSNVLFADDTMPFSIINDPIISADELDHDWAYQWKMELNPDHKKQATELLFTSGPKYP